MVYYTSHWYTIQVLARNLICGTCEKIFIVNHVASVHCEACAILGKHWPHAETTSVWRKAINFNVCGCSCDTLKTFMISCDATSSSIMLCYTYCKAKHFHYCFISAIFANASIKPALKCSLNTNDKEENTCGLAKMTRIENF